MLDSRPPTQTLIRACLAGGLLLATGAAFAQDADGDSVPDEVDVFPCDARASSVQYVPAADELGTLAFEDQWPSWSDLDFNDVVLRYRVEIRRDAAGLATSAHLRVAVAAAGGTYDNGLGWQLPVPRAAVTASRRRVGAGEWEALPLENDASATLRVSSGLREVFQGALGPVNVGLGELRFPSILEVELQLAPTTLDAGQAPFDLFIFQRGDFSHQIHLPSYAGTAAMNQALFGTQEDGSTASRRFVDRSGLPYAMNLHASSVYPLEGVPVSAVFPDVLEFAASAGASQRDFYLRPDTAAALHSPGPNLGVSNAPIDLDCVNPPGLVPGRSRLLAEVCPSGWSEVGSTPAAGPPSAGCGGTPCLICESPASASLLPAASFLMDLCPTGWTDRGAAAGPPSAGCPSGPCRLCQNESSGPVPSGASFVADVCPYSWPLIGFTPAGGPGSAGCLSGPCVICQAAE